MNLGWLIRLGLSISENIRAQQEIERAHALEAQARSEANAAGYAPSGAFVREPVSTPAPAPSASGFIDKDFSGYGAADDGFEFDVD